VLQRFDETTQHFSRSFKERLRFGLLNFRYILTQVLCEILKTRL